MLGLTAWMTMARKQRGYRAKSAHRIAGIKRVLVYAIVMSGILGVVALRRAQADTAEASRGLGRDLLALSDVLGDGQELRVNGESIRVASSVADTDVHTTLDRFEESCKADPSVVPLGTQRAGDDEEGVVLCLVGSQSSGRDLAAAFEAFARTQDLGALGKMRYAYAKKTASGTHVLAAWTGEHFAFSSLAPEGTADAPGNDSLLVPRPRGARRLLSAEVARSSYAVRVYASPEPVAEVVTGYDAAMKERGFELLADRQHEGERGYVRGGLIVIVTVERSEGGAVASIAELGANDTAAQ